MLYHHVGGHETKRPAAEWECIHIRDYPCVEVLVALETIRVAVNADDEPRPAKEMRFVNLRPLGCKPVTAPDVKPHSVLVHNGEQLIDVSKLRVDQTRYDAPLAKEVEPL
jgi:hypothetical protein